MRGGGASGGASGSTLIHRFRLLRRLWLKSEVWKVPLVLQEHDGGARQSDASPRCAATAPPPRTAWRAHQLAGAGGGSGSSL